MVPKKSWTISQYIFKCLPVLSLIIIALANGSDIERNTGPFNSPRAEGPRRLNVKSTNSNGSYSNVLRISRTRQTDNGQLLINTPSGEGTVSSGNGDLAGLLDLYNPHRLATKWNSTEESASNSTCFQHMTVFLSQLTQGQLWALQMSDSSGKYNGGFFWGNGYWMGSATHCNNIQPIPPFPLGFYVIKAHIQLNKSLTPQSHSQLLGVCLPLSCTPTEAEQILRISVNQSELQAHREVELSQIKTPHNVYYFSKDPTFWILVFVTSLVILLAICGTSLDMYQEYSSDKRKRAKYVYDNYTYEIAKTHHQEVITTTIKVPVGANNNENSEAESSERNSVNSEEMASRFSLLWREILLSFSLKKNIVTICEKSVGEDTIPTIHGLRSISMAWVILGHTCIIAFKYSDNMAYRSLVERELAFQTINNGAYSVDTFFFISGLLVSFLYFRTTAKHDMTKLTKATGFMSKVLEFLGLIGYRFARLTAPYFFVLGCVQVSMKWFHYNSVFETPTSDYINCPKYWWRNMLYINTLFPVQDMCMLWSWYLADDTQFYVLGALILIFSVKHFKVAFGIMSVLLVSSWGTTAMIAYNNNHVPNEDDPLALFDKIYDKPWTRLGPYLVGMSVGWILFRTDCKIKMHKVTVIIGWLASATLLLFLVYGLYGSKLSPVSAAAFSSLSHSAWALSLSWIVIACSTGYGGYVTKILSSSILYPFSRVTYCAYLVHPFVIRIFVMRMETPLHLGIELVIIMFIGHLVMSYLVSFVISLLFEAPIVSLLRIISPTKRKSKVNNP
ncbi:O-acyltransferase like protein [Rhodnius prolixus]|uniref:O-acyltransferase like protein n=1 Tax=Rhodnius prolixus TaxID=13249 RepID=UPI003D18EA52